MKGYLRIALAIGTLTVSLAAAADQLPRVVINGQMLSPWQLEWLEAQLGARIPPGSYLVDASGCWLNLGTGEGGCPQSAEVYPHYGSDEIDAGGSWNHYGSGETNADGSWNHYSDAADMGVGGTSDGCIYTTSGWSNC